MKEVSEGHTIKAYDDALADLRQRAQRMGTLVAGQVEMAVRALLDADGEAARLVLQRERQINTWQSEIESASFRLLARLDREIDQEFEAALRQLMTVAMERTRLLKPVFDTVFALKGLERIGDHARNVAGHVVFLVGGADVRHAGPAGAAAASETQH